MPCNPIPVDQVDVSATVTSSPGSFLPPSAFIRPERDREKREDVAKTHKFYPNKKIGYRPSFTSANINKESKHLSARVSAFIIRVYYLRQPKKRKELPKKKNSGDKSKVGHTHTLI